MSGEIKKILSPLYIKILFLIVLLISIVLTFLIVENTGKYISNTESSYINGSGTKEILYGAYDREGGYLSGKSLNKVLISYKKYKDEDTSYVESVKNFDTIIYLLNDAYVYDGEGGYSSLRNVKNTDDFYQQKIKRLKYEIGKISDVTKNEILSILNKARRVSTPYKFDYNKHWKEYIKILHIISVLVLVIGLFVASNIFYEESRTNMEEIIMCIGEKNIKKVAKKKILASVLVLNIFYLVCSLIVLSFLIANFGIRGWDTNIQTTIIFENSIYNINFFELCLLYNLINVISISMLILIVSFLSILLRNMIETIVSSVILFSMSVYASRINSFSWIAKLFSLSVFSINDTVRGVNSFMQYRIFFMDVSYLYAFLLISLFFIILLYKVVPILFYRYRLKE